MTFSEYLTSHGLTVADVAKQAHVRKSQLQARADKKMSWAVTQLCFAAAVAEVLDLNAQDMLDFDHA